MTNAAATEVALYRYFDVDGQLLYVGISADPVARMKQHRGRSRWWPQVASGACEVLPDRVTARAAETAAIRRERPLHNWPKRTAAAALRNPPAAGPTPVPAVGDPQRSTA